MTRDERLFQFFGCNFNQDWDLDGANSWEDVVDRYVAATPRRVVIATLTALREWLSSVPESANLPEEFGADYEPRVDGLTDVQWVSRRGSRRGAASGRAARLMRLADGPRWGVRGGAPASRH